MPFIDYGAALPAYSKEMLKESLQRAQHLSDSECEKMLKAQRAFIKDHAVPCDGKEEDRVVSFICEALKGF